MKKQFIISLALFVAIITFIIFNLLPNKARRGRNNDNSMQPIELSSTNNDGGVFTVRLGGMRFNGTNVPISNTNVKFTIVQTNN